MGSAYPQVWHGLVAKGTRQPLEWYEKVFVLSVCVADVNFALPFDELKDCVVAALNACGMDTTLASKMYGYVCVCEQLCPVLRSVLQNAREPTRGLFFCHLMKVADSLYGLASDLTACVLVYMFHGNQMDAARLLDWIQTHTEQNAVLRLCRAGLDWQRFLWGMAQADRLWLSDVFTYPKVLGEVEPEKAPAELLAFYCLPNSTLWLRYNCFEQKQWDALIRYDLMKVAYPEFYVTRWFAAALYLVSQPSFQDKERVLAGLTNVVHLYAKLSETPMPYPCDLARWLDQWKTW
jgi:hypothetical protein